MKKIFLISTLLLSVLTFSQKDELKALNKISNRSSISEKDYNSYIESLTSLKGLSNNNEFSNDFKFYEDFKPFISILAKGDKISVIDLINELNESSYSNYLGLVKKYNAGSIENEDYKSKIKESVSILKSIISNNAIKMNADSKQKEAAILFYNVYLIDNNEGSNLENAAILAFQAKEFKLCEKYYRELYLSSYTGSGTFYYATNTLSKVEESFSSKNERDIFVKTGSHNSPREEVITSKKKDYIKAVAMLSVQNGNLEAAKKDYADAKKLNNGDLAFLIEEANLYYETKDFVTYEKLLIEALPLDPNNINILTNLGYIALKPEAKIVEQINASTAPEKRDAYNKFILDRKDLYKKALPYFEKIYKIDALNVENKNILKACYEVLGMEDKVKSLN